MANEIQVSLSLTVSKNGASATASESITQTMSGDQFLNSVQIIGTSNEVLNFGDVTAGGWVVCKNLDATNYVEIFLDSGNAQLVAKLLPGASGAGEACKFKPGAAVYARANTAPVNLQVFTCEL
jgi:hypothetical protein